MATKTKTEAEEPIPEERKPLLDAARMVLLAGIGAIALAEEEIMDFVNKLVERGEIAEQDGKNLIREIMAKRKKDAVKAEDEFSNRVEDILDRMNVPTKADIDSLGKKITALSKKVDELKETQT